MGDYMDRENKTTQELAKQLKDLSGLPFTVERKEERDRIILVQGDCKITVTYYEYQKDYNFFLERLPYNVWERDVIETLLKQGIKTPNKMHTPNRSAILKWVEYEKAVWEVEKIESARRVRAVQKKRAEWEALGFTIKEGHTPDTFSVREAINGIEYRGEVTTEGYISERIELYTYNLPKEDTLTQFLKLSRNAYRGNDEK